MNEVTVPEGFKKDAKGNFVAIDNIKEIDLLRDDLVNRLTQSASKQCEALVSFKHKTMGEVDSFIELSASEHNVKLGGKKGNVTLLNFDGTKKVQLQIADCISYDERLQQAKSLLDECARDWSHEADNRAKTIIEYTFQVNRKGEISKARLFELRKMDMKDERWDQAMNLIADSIQVVGSKEYIRFYERRTSADAWQPISLDLANL